MNITSSINLVDGCYEIKLTITTTEFLNKCMIAGLISGKRIKMCDVKTKDTFLNLEDKQINEFTLGADKNNLISTMSQLYREMMEINILYEKYKKVAILAQHLTSPGVNTSEKK